MLDMSETPLTPTRRRPVDEYLGNTASASWAREHQERARIGFEDFWDPTRGGYVDHILAGQQMPAVSQAAGAVAIVSGIAPQERWARIADVITDSSRLVIRSWIGGADGGYDMTKIVEHSQGIYRIDWDVDREIVLAEPFYQRSRSRRRRGSWPSRPAAGHAAAVECLPARRLRHVR